MRHRFPLRVPQTPHRIDDRLVPVHNCGCETCREVRVAADAAHMDLVGDLLGAQDYGMCRCGRALDEDGRCLAQGQCEYFEAVRR